MADLGSTAVAPRRAQGAAAASPVAHPVVARRAGAPPHLRSVVPAQPGPAPGATPALDQQVAQLHRHCAAEIDAIDRALDAHLAGLAQPASHYGMLRHHLGFADAALRPLPATGYLPRGKRLRPLVCLLLCQLFPLPHGVAQTLMMANEVMHAASLVHDDVEDRDTLRWGRPTLAAAFGSAQAINAGDALVGLVYQLLLGLRQQGVNANAVLELVDVFSQAQLRMCEGQHLDLRHHLSDALGVDDYFDRAARTTGAPCVCIGEGVAVLGQASAAERQALARFGRALGILYQIADDVRGLWGQPAQLGRAAGHDLAQQRPSLPLLYGLQLGPPELHQAMAAVAERGALPDHATLEAIRQALVACGAGRSCHADALAQHQAALSALQALGRPGKATHLLTELLDACLGAVAPLAPSA